MRGHMATMLTFYAGILGALIGSFLNVVIHRWPREESIVFPASHCPHCNAKIRPWDNVPVVSWLLLGGRCRDCREPIALRYPLVELANGLFYAATFQRTGLAWEFVPVAAIVSMTIVLIFIDVDVQFLPDVITYPGIVVGLALAALGGGSRIADIMLARTLVDSAAGALIGAGSLLAIALSYKLVRKVEGMGYGDVKMMAMIGAVSGWQVLFPLLLLASIVGSVFGILAAIRDPRGMQVGVPFGVFLGLAFLVVLFFGPTLWGWYLALLLR